MTVEGKDFKSKWSEEGNRGGRGFKLFKRNYREALGVKGKIQSDLWETKSG